MSEAADPGPVSGSYSAICPFTIDRVAMFHRWDKLTFLHWPYPPDQVQALLPPGLTVETYDGTAWVGLVPFLMEVNRRDGRLPGWPFRFPETNVRTYVTGPTGERGVWFLSLDSARLGAVPVARSTYRVRYFWSRMGVAEGERSITYSSRRRWPGRSGALSQVTVDIGDRYDPAELTDFDHYLTARWVMYGSWGDRLLIAYAAHEPWVLHRASVRCLDQLVAATGLPSPVGDPVAHWSPGVDVTIGYPRHVDALES